MHGHLSGMCSRDYQRQRLETIALLDNPDYIISRESTEEVGECAAVVARPTMDSTVNHFIAFS